MNDSINWKILELLQENARLSFAQIGREVGLSPSAVAERIQRLEDDGVITRHTSLLDTEKLGYGISVYINLGFKDDGYKVFLNSLSRFPEITECSRVTGQDCLIMKVVLRNQKHLAEFIDRLIPFGTPSTSVILSDIITSGKIVRPEN